MHAYLSHKNVWHVQVPGALLSLGDAHTSQGDSEFDGTAIETSLTATLKITLHKKGSLPKFVSKLNFPLLENANEYVVHGFTYNVSALIFPVFLLSPLSCMVCSPERVNTSEHCDLSSFIPAYDRIYCKIFLHTASQKAACTANAKSRPPDACGQLSTADMKYLGNGMLINVPVLPVHRITSRSWTCPSRTSTTSRALTGPSLWPTTTPGAARLPRYCLHACAGQALILCREHRAAMHGCCVGSKNLQCATCFKCVHSIEEG